MPTAFDDPLVMLCEVETGRPILSMRQWGCLPDCGTADWNTLGVRTFFVLLMKYGFSGTVIAWKERPEEVATVAALMEGFTVSG